MPRTGYRIYAAGTDRQETKVQVPAFHLSLPAIDLERTTAFYVDVLGCQRGRTGPDWADLSFFGHQLSLHEHPGHVPDDRTCEVDGIAVPLRHHGVVLETGVWDAVVARLQTAGQPFLLSPRSRFVGDPGEQHTFFVADPSGNAIEIKAFPGGAWT